MTTPLTIYRFGLCGNSANESIGKHCFRTKKHQKVNKSSQKTTPRRFGYWRPRVRVPPLRPKKSRQPMRLSTLFLVKAVRTKTCRCEAECEFAYPARTHSSGAERGYIRHRRKSRRSFLSLSTPYFARALRRKQLSTVSASLTQQFDPQKSQNAINFVGPCACFLNTG